MKPRLVLLVIVIAALIAGATIMLLTRSSDTTPATAVAPDTSIQVQTRVLDRPDAEHPAAFTTIAGVRELRDGRVLVLDSRERTVQILDPVVVRMDDDDLEHLQRYRLN